MAAPIGPVLANNRIDEAKLSSYLRGKLAGFDEPFEIRQFQAGQSNPTYRIDTRAGSYVLRKKPSGELVASAHKIEREYQVMSALDGTVPVPRMLHFCSDPTVIGQTFYVMQHVEGRVMPDARLLDADPADRPMLVRELVGVLAKLHRADYKTLGLSDFGRPMGYLARQLALWTKQYAAARLEDNADMNRLIPWLEANLPSSDEAAIVHGDYRGYNVMFGPNEPRLIAVLDWELATIGHPLADLAYFCLPYHLPADDLRGFRGESPGALNIPPESEVIASYCRMTDRSDIPHWRYYLVFSLFRSAAIRAGVFKRAHDGTASSEQALEAGSRYRVAAESAWRLAQAQASL